MTPVISYTPVVGTSQQVYLPLQSGMLEIINDSNMLLLVTTNNGQCMQVPGEVQLYPTPAGGGQISIQCVLSNNQNPSFLFLVPYMDADAGPVDTVSVNQFLDGEILGRNYPYFLTRSVQLNNTQIPTLAQQTVSSISAGCTATMFNSGSVGLLLYIWGFDMTIDQESSSHAVTLTVTGLQNLDVLTYYYRTKTNSETVAYVRFDQAIPATNINTNIVVSIAAVSGGTAKAAINAYGYAR